ncbi:MAG: CoA-binding protein [Candidatus Kariarchaeaceae archaeon]|jgi:predicted CoA-binding protein
MEELERIKEFLSNPGPIAIVGASSKKEKAGCFVPKYLKSLGFRIIPVNPKIDVFLGEKPINRIEDIDEEVVGVIIFRKRKDAEEEALKAINLGIPMIWLPDNITSRKAKKIAEEQNIFFVQDRCALRDGRNLLK